MALKNKVREAVLRYNMLGENERILVALSGGADSVCLLNVLLELKDSLKISCIAAAHLNHGLRASADRDMEFCERLCREKGIELFKKTMDIKAYASQLKTCEEDAGRIARYGFFHKLCEENGFSRIATAHNMNDQAETFLMRVISGSSLEGLGSVKPVREDNVIRPLIGVKRCDIESYLEEKNQEYVTDETNFSDVYKRNSLRLRLIPFIEESYNPNIIETAAAMAEGLLRDSEYISAKARELSSGISFPESLGKLSVQDDAVLIRAMSLVLNTTFSRNAKDSLVKFIKKGKTGSSFPVDKSKYLYIEYGRLYLKEASASDNSYCYTLHLGVNYIRELDASFTVSEGESREADCVNVSSLSDLKVRSRRDGDRIYIKAIKGSKKIKDIFIDRKIPKDIRSIWPVVTEDEKIIWLTGIYKNENKDAKYNIKAEWRYNNV